MSLLLEARGLSHSFDYLLYKDVSLSLRDGDSLAVMGRSGSGKSTLLHTLAGLIKPLKGEVFLFGKEFYSLKENEQEKIIRYQTGVIFQSHYLFKGMSGLENIEIATLLSKKEIDYSLIERLEIDKIIDKKVSEISGGQQQRVSLARVLSKKPKIIFADEPTGNLDEETAKIVMDTLLEYTKSNEAGLFLVTHDLEIAKLCSREYLLENGQLKIIQ